MHCVAILVAEKSIIQWLLVVKMQRIYFLPVVVNYSGRSPFHQKSSAQ